MNLNQEFENWLKSEEYKKLAEKQEKKMQTEKHLLTLTSKEKTDYIMANLSEIASKIMK